MKTIQVFIFSLLLLNIRAYTQTTHSADSLREMEQTCLDKGDNMVGCAIDYCYAMDKLLNQVYSRLMKTLPRVKCESLKTEQKAWLRKRDAFFRKNQQAMDKKYKNRPVPQDDEMFRYEENGDFVKDRVEILLRSL